MADFGDKLASLPALTLRELRLLASRIGLGRYGALTRRSLMEAIRSRISPGTSSPAVPEAPAPIAAAPASEPSPAAPPMAPAAAPAPAVVAAAAAPEVVVPAPVPVSVATPPAAEPVLMAEAIPAAVAKEPVAAPVAAPPVTTWIVFQPQSDRWAEVRWSLSDDDRAAFQSASASGLRLRLADVTGQSDGSALPHALQEVVVDAGTLQWYLPIPLADRTYRVELGYRINELDGWRTLVISAPAHVPASPQEPEGQAWNLPFEMEAPVPAMAVTPTAAPAFDLHERLYQVASIAWRRNAAGSEEYMERRDSGEGAGAEGFHASGEGFWASGLQDSGAGGVAARQRSFWLVADAELIVHAATEPSALLKIGEAPHALSEEGTIRLHVPFPDGEQHYPITAIAADGEQKRNVTLSFERTTPHARTNRREEAVAEWF